MRLTLTHGVQKLPVQHAQSASKSVRRPANHVAISTYKASPASSGFLLTKPAVVGKAMREHDISQRWACWLTTTIDRYCCNLV